MKSEFNDYLKVKDFIKDRQIVCFDLETTGLEPGYVVEFGAIKYEKNTLERIEDCIHLVKPPISIPAELVAIHGISDEMVKDEKTFADQHQEFAKILLNDNPIIMGHNVSFDIKFIEAEYKRLGFEFDRANYDYICTRNMAKWMANKGYFDNKKSNALQHLALNVFGIPDPGHHRSENDVIVCMELFKKLLTLLP